MTLSLDRQNAYRERYRQTRPGWHPATEVFETLIRSCLEPRMRVLDLGCGRGGVLEQLGPAVSRPIGFDPDGQSLAEHRIADLPRSVALADWLPLRSQSVDLIVCSWVIEHVEDPERVFSEIARCLKPYGAFIFLTPNRYALVTRLNRLLRPIQKGLVRRLYGRAEADTFPVLYRANDHKQLARLGTRCGLVLENFQEIADPSYLAFNEVFYRISFNLSRITPPVHLTGVFRRLTIK